MRPLRSYAGRRLLVRDRVHVLNIEPIDGRAVVTYGRDVEVDSIFFGIDSVREKVGRLVRRPTQRLCRELSADVGDSLLGIFFGSGRRLCRQLKHCGHLILS